MLKLNNGAQVDPKTVPRLDISPIDTSPTGQFLDRHFPDRRFPDLTYQEFTSIKRDIFLKFLQI